MQNDLRIASRLVAQLDAKHCLWSLPGEEEDSGAVTKVCPVPGLPGVMSSNPLMRNLIDFFAEETTSGLDFIVKIHMLIILALIVHVYRRS